MGYYIDRTSEGDYLPSNGKAAALTAAGDIIKEFGRELPPYQPNLVCIAHNGPFEAAAYAYSKAEYDRFRLTQGRPQFWYLIRDAAKLSGYAR